MEKNRGEIIDLSLDDDDNNNNNNNNSNKNKNSYNYNNINDNDCCSDNNNSKRKRNVGDPLEFTFVTINIDKLEIDKIRNTVDAIVASLNDLSKPDIIFIQETKLKDNNLNVLLKQRLKDYGYEVFHNNVWSSLKEFKHGTCVLVRTSSVLSEGYFLKTFDWDVEGRVTVWKSNYGTFVGVYAATPNMKPETTRQYSDSGLEVPKRFMHRKAFDEKLKAYLKSEQEQGFNIITLGDWNCTLDVIDTSTKKLWPNHYDKCRKRHEQLKSELNLIDIWRCRNPESQNRYTSRVTHLEKPSLVRIDMILIPARLINRVRFIDIMDNSNFLYGDRGDIDQPFKYNLNHVPVVMKIELSQNSSNDDVSAVKSSRK